MTKKQKVQHIHFVLKTSHSVAVAEPNGAKFCPDVGQIVLDRRKYDSLKRSRAAPLGDASFEGRSLRHDSSMTRGLFAREKHSILAKFT